MKALGLAATAALVSGLLCTLALPAFDLGFFAWIALVPLLCALRRHGLPGGALAGAIFGFAFGVGTLYWIAEFPAMNAFRFAALGVLFSLYYAAFGALYAAASRSLGGWMILFAPALWVALEYARASAGFLAFPWNLLGHSQHQALPVIQVADLAGAYGVSFLLVMVNELVSRIREPGWAPRAATAGALVASALAYGVIQLMDDPLPEAKVRVAVVQANMPTWNRMSSDEQVRHLAAYSRLTRQAAKEKPALIVWPSASLPGPISYWMIRLYVSDLAHRAGVPLLIGGAGGDKLAPGSEGHLPFSNSQFLLSPAGALEGRYDKIHLTPFTEQVPLQGIVRWPRWITAAEKGFVPGEAYTLFQVAGARFGAPICWETSFPDLFRRFVLRGADFMVSVTNENAFGATSGPYQTLAMNVFRAVENRVAVARAATTGVSAFIDSRGRLVSRVRDAAGADLYVAGILVWDVPVSKERSFYTRHGDRFAQAVSLAALAWLVLALLRGQAGRSRQAPPARATV